MVRLTREPIEYHALTEQVRRPECGAVVTFLGTVRDLTADRVTVALDYEAYPEMALKKLAEIEADTRERPVDPRVVLSQMADTHHADSKFSFAHDAFILSFSRPRPCLPSC